MNPLTTEWVAKAEDDFATSGREMTAAPRPNYDAACFHAQQCAEKYLKARLIEAGVAFPKTHDLDAVLKLALPIEPGWLLLKSDLHNLTALAVEVRYPGFSASASEAQRAVDVSRKVRAAARTSLGLSV